jgi:hypothetical protein
MEKYFPFFYLFYGHGGLAWPSRMQSQWPCAYPGQSIHAKRLGTISMCLDLPKHKPEKAPDEAEWTVVLIVNVMDETFFGSTGMELRALHLLGSHSTT